MLDVASPPNPDVILDALANGHTLPASWYTDPEVWRLELDRVFHRSWQYVGRADRVSKPGDYITDQVADIPVVVVRDKVGDLRAFANVCRHRFHAVAHGSGNCKRLQCDYHGWTYNLDGTLWRAPRFDRVPEFDREAFPLRPLRVETFRSLIFVNADSAAPSLSDQFGDLEAIMLDRGFDVSALRFVCREEFPVACNWKAYLENGSECYHCPTIHPELAEMSVMDLDVYTFENHEYFACQNTLLRNPKAKGQRTDKYGFQAYRLWPNLVIIAHPFPESGMAPAFRALLLRPVDAEHLVLVSDLYADDALSDQDIEAALEFGHMVTGQDRKAVETVQLGIRSGTVSSGCVMADSEDLIKHWYGVLYRALTNGSA